MKILNLRKPKLMKARNLKYGQCCYIKNQEDLYMKIPTGKQPDIYMVKKDHIVERYGASTHTSKLVNLVTGRIKCVPVHELFEKVEAHVNVTD